MRGPGNELHSNEPDTTDPVGAKFRRACEIVETEYDDRRPSRDTTGQRSREWRPLGDVSRGGKLEEYKKWPQAKG